MNKTNKIFKVFGIVMSFFVLSSTIVSCNDNNKPDDPIKDDDNDDKDKKDDEIKWGYNGALNGSELYNEFFNYESDIKINLEFSHDVATFMNSYQSTYDSKYNDAYLPANISIDINGTKYDYDDVGIRMKGNTTRREFYNGQSIYNSVHFKVSFKATFDSELYDDTELLKFKHTWNTKEEKNVRKDRNFAGMDKIDLKYLPRNWRQGAPGCNIQEIYCYDAFRKVGLLSPCSNACNLTMKVGNDTFTSYYQIVECIDKQFLKKRFSKDEAKGDLYKVCGTSLGCADFTRLDAVTKEYDNDGNNIGTRVPNGKIGVEDSYIHYKPVYDLKTNDDGEDSDFSSMTNFINVLWNVSYNNASKDELEKILDVDYFLAYSAMAVILGNPDDIRFNSNNLYVYFLPSTNKAYFIPYDYDWSLGWYWDNCYNGDLATQGIWNENRQSGNTSLFHATFFKSGEVSYSKEPYQFAYRKYVNKYLNNYDTLNYDSYLEMSNTIKYVNNNELSVVQSYMNTKTTAIINSLYER